MKIIQFLLSVFSFFSSLNICAMGEEIFEAVKQGQTQEVKALVAKNINFVKVQDESKSTPLHIASISGHSEIVQFLVESKADIEAKDINRSTPLHRAAGSGDIEVVKLLVGEKANVNARNKFKATPLHQASFLGPESIRKFLLSHGANPCKPINLFNIFTHHIFLYAQGRQVFLNKIREKKYLWLRHIGNKDNEGILLPPDICNKIAMLDGDIQEWITFKKENPAIAKLTTGNSA